MSGADHFDVLELNPYSKAGSAIDRSQAVKDFLTIQDALRNAGVTISSYEAPAGCQDGVFTANWGLCRGDTVVLSSLPNQRKAEEPHAHTALSILGFRVIKAPFRFSGQGDALPCGNILFAGSGYRTDPRMHDVLASELGYEVVSVEAIPHRDAAGHPVINRLTGLPDSFFYDIDLAISVISPDLIAWFPGAFTPASQERIRQTQVRKIEVTREDAYNFGCNLVSTGHTVIMGSAAPTLTHSLQAEGLQVITVDVAELPKGGGFIRCTTLTLDND